MKNLLKQAKEDSIIALFLVQGFTVSIFFITSLALLLYGFMHNN